MNIENSQIIQNLPHNVDAEAYLLASLLIDPNSFEKILEMNNKISSQDFYDIKHQHIYSSLEDLKKKNIPIDIITLTDKLKSLNLIDKSGGIEYITGLLDKIPTSANIEYYADIVKKKSMLRSVIQVCKEAIGKSLQYPENVENILEETEKKIFDINEEKHSSAISHIKDNIYQVIEIINKGPATGEISGIPTGYYMLDELTDGFHNSELVVIAARPSMGKTSLALNMISKTAIKNNTKIGFFSCEMSKTSLVKRMLCSGASVDQLLMRRNMLKNEDIVRLSHEAERLYDTTIVFDDTANIPLLELRAKARRMYKDFGVEIIFIDYLQLITLDETMAKIPRHEQIAYVSRSLKALARQLDIPIVALAQLNRDIETRGEDSRPRLSDLKDSGSIEQDSDLILFIHKGQKSQAIDDYGELAEPREILIGKNRNGPTGAVKMIFHKPYTRFELLKKEEIY
ncbi:MAG: replicative DNA helicase [Spirochaetes bacterium]|nr:replicative DNA helicase [Spirochaetota bacterium]